MKKNILFLFFSFSLFALHAQDLTLEPQQVDIEEALNGDNDHAGYSIVTNTTAESRKYIWERNVLNITQEWESAVCDNIRCYFPHVSTQEFDLGPSEGGDMIVHVYPNGVEGSASIEVKIYDKSDTTSTITGLYNFTLGTTGTVEVSRQLLKVFPNPTKGEINLQFLLDRPTNMKVEIQNIIGQRLSMEDFGKMSGEQTVRLNKEELNNGLYFVVIHLDEYVMTKKIKVKR